MSEKNILVVDDEDYIRELVRDFLEMEDLNCLEAASFEEADKIVSGNRLDLILLDRNLEGAKAEEIIGKLRDAQKDVPVVLVTGDIDCDQAFVERVHADGLIHKPFQFRDFIQKIKLFLENK